MPKIYKIETGDTFALIARKQYGDDQQSQTIANANPGVFEPLVVGSNISIPEQQGVARFVVPNQPANNENEVTIVTDNKTLRFWSQISFARSIDSFDTFTFQFPFDSENEELKSIFQPFSYKQVTVSIGGMPQFIGTMVGISPTVSEKIKVLNISCYSKPGVLNDCTAPIGLYDSENASTELQFEGQTLRQIAEYFCAPFGIDVLFNDESTQVFEKVSLNPVKKILPFLTDLARQRGLVMTSGGGGQLLFQKSVGAGNPVAVLTQGESPLSAVSAIFTPQSYYSHVIGIQPVTLGLGLGLTGFAGSQYVVTNPNLEGVLRPISKQITDSSGALITDSTISEYSRMLAGSVKYSASVATWRDPDGDLWIPNTTIKLTAPDAMIYSEYEFLISKVVFSANDSAKTAVLELVLPESYSNERPKVMPWE